jgi:thiamine biosynthesis lipoprotein
MRSASAPTAGARQQGFAPLESNQLVRVGRRAMACRFEVLVPAKTDDQIDRAAEALDIIDTVEDELSAYRSESCLSRLNRTAAQRPAVVPERVFALLEHCRRLCEQTGGAFDVTIGPLVRCWGFFRRQGRIPSSADLTASLSLVGIARFALHPADRTVVFEQHGVEINLGAVGKGFALDAAMDHLTASGTHAALLHGGYSSILARGSLGDGEGWPVGIRHPLRPGKRLATLRLREQGLATSGSGEQYFRHEGRRYSHLIDPRTGHPVEGMLSVTAVAPTAAEADALATAFFVLGVEKTREYCENHSEVSALLVPEPDRGGPLQVVAVGTGLHDLKVLESE